MTLKLSNDRKVTPAAKQSSGRWVPMVSNAFGLPAHLSCPGKTTVCDQICYAFRIEKAYKSSAALLKHNWDTLQECNGDVKKMEVLLTELVANYRKSYEKAQAKLDKKIENVFRIHWDGDFFSTAYAEAWKAVILANPDIQFWVYTRSFNDDVNVVPILCGIDNLSLYLSVDEVNRELAEKIAAAYPVKLAFLDKTFDEGLEKIVKITSKKAPKCPEQTGKYALVTNEHGACVECMLCVNGTNNVLFSISKK